jgi:hypothetical protein
MRRYPTMPEDRVYDAAVIDAVRDLPFRDAIIVLERVLRTVKDAQEKHYRELGW